MDACFERYGVGGLAAVEMTIAPSGTVSAAELRWAPFSSTSPTGVCVVQAVLTARFPPFEGAPQKISYPIVLEAHLLDRAQKAYVAGQFADAIAFAEKAKSDDPQRALRVIGASRCFLHDAAAAASAWKELNATGRRFVEYVCGNNHVHLDPR